MTGQHVGYIRVSSTDQNTERQLDGVHLDKAFTDKVSGKDLHRPALMALLDHIREGDTVHVHDISRMARNLLDLKQLVGQITDKGVTLHFHKENLIFTGDDSPMQALMLSMLGAVYEFERAMMLERQREGIQQAKQAGKYKGRKRSADRDQIMNLLQDGHSMRETARLAGVSLSTVQRVKAEHEAMAAT